MVRKSLKDADLSSDMREALNTIEEEAYIEIMKNPKYNIEAMTWGDMLDFILGEQIK